MSNDCGFLANIKEEGTKNTDAPCAKTPRRSERTRPTCWTTFRGRGIGLHTKVKVISCLPLASRQGTGGETGHPALPPTATQPRARRAAAAGGPGGVPGPAGQSRCPPPRTAAGPRQHCQAVCLLRCQLTEAETERATETSLLLPPKLLDSEPQAAARGWAGRRGVERGGPDGGVRASPPALPKRHGARAGPGELARAQGPTPGCGRALALLTKSRVGWAAGPRAGTETTSSLEPMPVS